jgi:lysophospholipase L1-like esterase
MAGIARPLAGLVAVAMMCVTVAASPLPPDDESNGGVRLMPLGDSITDGFGTPGGYRPGLWRLIEGGGGRVDFVGSMRNGPARLGDHGHEGHSGYRIDQLDAYIGGWLRAARPRTVLLHIGTNDIVQNHDLRDAPKRLSALIDRILAGAPGVELFVARITPLADPSWEARVRAYNAAMTGVVRDKGPHAHLVDMHDALTLGDLADGVHPNAGGYAKMSTVWYDALRSVPGSLSPLG